MISVEFKIIAQFSQAKRDTYLKIESDLKNIFRLKMGSFCLLEKG